MAGHQTNLPMRSEGGYISDDDVFSANNPTDATEIMHERLQAWKHMCGYLEGYISEVAKDQKSQAKDQEKILKTVSHPLRESHHFDQNAGGVAGLFQNLQTNTQAQINLHSETSKSLTSSVLPILEKLHSEIKAKTKELDKGAGKGSKAVDSARQSSQKSIELLGQHTAGFGAAGAKMTAQNDPYVIQRQVAHRLNKQLIEENSNRGDLIAVQNSFAQFEAHVLQTVQAALNQFNQYMSGQADRARAIYGNIASTASAIPLDHEWNGFLKRNSDKLIDPNAPQRSMSSITYPNQDHPSTRPLISGTLERKGKGLGSLSGYSTHFYAITPAGFLHEYKDNDDYSHDPTPETSLYLPDSVVGALDGLKFAVKGKDTSGGKISQKLSSSSEYTFKAMNAQDAAQWHKIIAQSAESPAGISVNPVADQKVAPINTQPTAAVPGTQAEPYSATTATPHSATAAHAPQTVGSAVPQSATSTVPPHTYVAGQPGTAL